MIKMTMAPPPMRIGGIQIAFQLAGTSRTCTKVLEELAEQVNFRSLLASKLSTTLDEIEQNAVLDLAEAIMSGDLKSVLAVAHQYIDAPHRLAIYRDTVADLLSSMEGCSTEIIPTRPFRMAVAGAQTDAVDIVLKDKATSLVVVVASTPLKAPEVFSLSELPSGEVMMEAKPMFDPIQLYTNIHRVKTSA